VIVGVIYDPIREEFWSGAKGKTATLNGKKFRLVAAPRWRKRWFDRVGEDERDDRRRFAPPPGDGAPGAQVPNARQRRARHGLCRLRPARRYIEQGISLWDIAAGWLLVECAGGACEMKPRERSTRQIQHRGLERSA
jgi:myo-inositol-1(or 4)-monophosphatase